MAGYSNGSVLPERPEYPWLHDFPVQRARFDKVAEIERTAWQPSRNDRIVYIGDYLYGHKQRASIDSDASVEKRFTRLANQWRAEKQLVSSAEDIILNPAYQQIIGMGKPAIALILRDLANRPDHWFWALHCITGEQPANPADGEDLARLAKVWLDWGKARGFA